LKTVALASLLLACAGSSSVATVNSSARRLQVRECLVQRVVFLLPLPAALQDLSDV
jgi:hypothetical protein